MKTINELMSLKDKVAIVTGGSGFLGKAICETLAELGATVVVASRTGKKCEEYALTLNEKFGNETLGLSLDITSISSIQSVIKRVEDEFGRIDILVNNAWSGNKNSFESISYEDWQYDIDVCLNGVFYISKEATNSLKSTEGVILNIASMYGHVAPDYRMYDGKKYANPPSYGAAKAGVLQLTKYMASFLSPHKIRVNAISPGPFPFPSTVDENPKFISVLSSKNMLNRIGTPDDLKGAVALLCTQASKYMTAQNVKVDGGWSEW